MGNILASVIILNYNGADYIEGTLRAVFGQSVISMLKVIVLDQASTDGSRELIKGKYEDKLTLIESDKNLGFTGGCNHAFKYAEGAYVLLLGNDAVPDSRWAESLIRVAESDRTVGMCTSKILFYRNRNLIDCVGHTMYPDGLNRSTGNYMFDEGQYNQVEETLFASGCAALYRRNVIDAVGGFDEDFFWGADDTDLGMKIRLQGLRCLYVPQAVVYHLGSQSFGKYTLKKLYYIERNRVWILFKYLPVSYWLSSPWFTFRRLWAAFRSSAKGGGIAGGLRRHNSILKILMTLVFAWFSSLLKIPSMLVKRRRIMRGKKISWTEYKELLRRFRPSLEDMAFSGPADLEGAGVCGAIARDE